MDFYSYSFGWGSGFIAGFAVGGLFIHILTLMYWHFYISNFVKRVGSSTKDNDLLFQGIASALPHIMRKGRNLSEEE